MQSEQEPTAFLHSEDGLNTGGVATIGRRNRPHESAMSQKTEPKERTPRVRARLRRVREPEPGFSGSLAIRVEMLA